MPFTGFYTPVTSPPLRPPTSGLLQAADVVPHADDAWTGGVSWQSANNAVVELYDLCSANGTVALAKGATATTGVGPSFSVVEREQCTGGGFAANDFQARALEGLSVRESWAVERQLAADPLAIADFVPLSDPSAAQPVGVNAVHAIKGLALLDQAIANANIGQGMIHAQPYIVALWNAGGGLLVGERGGRILSPNGNVIVSGNGYTGVGPDGAGAIPADLTAGAVWAFATDLIAVHRQATPTVRPANLAQAMDTSVNTIRYYAERAYAIAWARLLHAAVKIIVDHDTAP